MPALKAAPQQGAQGPQRVGGQKKLFAPLGLGPLSPLLGAALRGMPVAVEG